MKDFWYRLLNLTYRYPKLEVLRGFFRRKHMEATITRNLERRAA